MKQFKTKSFFMDSVTFSREQIENLQVGDFVENCFGQMKMITSIHHKGFDVNGNFFVCFYQQFGETSQMSHSIKEDRKINFV